MVRMRGLEPPHLSAPEPKSGVSTNSTTSASGGIIGFYSFDVASSELIFINSSSKSFNFSLRDKIDWFT